MKAPERLQTPRLLLRRPQAEDAETIFARYAGDPEVTRYMAWPTHTSVADTRHFIAFSDLEWTRWPAGPYLIVARSDRFLLGSTGLAFETSDRAITGYILSRDAWGQGFATEALSAMVDLAHPLGVRRLAAACHAGHTASARVLEKCWFVLEARLARDTVFPNLGTGEPADVLVYARHFPGSAR